MFTEREFGSWWYETGTPTFLIEALKKRGGISTLGLRGMSAGGNLLSTFDVGNIKVPALLFQAVTYQKTWPPAVRAVARPITD